MKTDRPPVLPSPLIKNRLRALLVAREYSLSALAVACDVTSRHLDLVLAGHRPMGRRLAEALRCELGENGWAFAAGESESFCLTAPASSRGNQS